MFSILKGSAAAVITDVHPCYFGLYGGNRLTPDSVSQSNEEGRGRASPMKGGGGVSDQ